MKFLIAFLFISVNVIAQDTTKFPGASAQIAFNSVAATTAYASQPIHSVNLQITFAEAKPVKAGPYTTLASLKAVMLSYHNQGIGILIQSNTDQNSPAWVLTEVGTYTTNSGSQPGPYPYQMNPLYQTYVLAHMDSLLRNLSELPDSLKNGIIGIQFGHGSTGDLEPQKGESFDYSYDNDGDGDLETQILETDAPWIAYTFRIRDSLNAKIIRYFGANTVRPLNNMGNDGTYYSRDRKAYPRVMGKDGFFTHSNGFKEEKTLAERDQQYKDRTGVGYEFFYTRGENQGYAAAAKYPNKEHRLQKISEISAGTQYANIVQAYISNKETYQSVASPYALEIFNFYSGYTNSYRRGFSYPHHIPDFKDALRFPESAFGVVIDPAKLGGYNSGVAAINASTDSLERKTYLLARAISNRGNPARELAIRAAFPQLSFSENDDDSSYFNDFGYGLRPNYEMNLYFVDTCRILARIGPDTSSFGRFCYQVENSSLKRYDIDNRLIKVNGSDLVRLKVTYYDSLTTSWSIILAGNSCKQKTALSVTNTATNTWKTVSVDISRFKYRSNSYDFGIKGQGLIYEIVEVDILSKE